MRVMIPSTLQLSILCTVVASAALNPNNVHVLREFSVNGEEVVGLFVPYYVIANMLCTAWAVML